MKKKPTQPRTVAAARVYTPVRLVSGLALAGLLVGCAVGPDFKRPDPPAASRYTAQAAPAKTTSAATAG